MSGICYWVVILHKYSPNTIAGSIILDHKVMLNVGHCQNWGRYEDLLKVFEGHSCFIAAMEVSLPKHALRGAAMPS